MEVKTANLSVLIPIRGIALRGISPALLIFMEASDSHDFACPVFPPVPLRTP
jgi:hypothetical protein